MNGRFGIIFQIAWRNLKQGGRRNWLLGGAIAFVTLLLVGMTALASGLETTMIRSASTLMSGHVNVGGFYKITRTQVAPVITDVAKLRALVKRVAPDAEMVDRMRGWAKVVSPTGAFHAALSGVDIDEEARLRDVLQVVHGSLDALRPNAQGTSNAALLFERQAKRLDVKVGDDLTLSADTVGGVRNTADLRVGAIVKDVGSLSALTVFVPKSVVRTLYGLDPDASGAIQIYLEDPDEAPAVMRTLRSALEADKYRLMRHQPQPFFMKFERVISEDWAGQKLDLTTWRDEISYMLWILKGFSTIRWLLLSGLLVIVVIGIMNTMWMVIRERTREIGTVRAIGMSRGGVLSLFLLEGLGLGLIASIVGAVIGAITIAILNAAEIPIGMQAFQMVMMSDRLILELRVSDLFSAVASITAITTIAAFYPAWRAARMRPVKALGYL
ncbi:MAG: putative ABC transport system permease protein [Bradymonadia bacterium]|jgi:putative ABC transport system permease protein